MLTDHINKIHCIQLNTTKHNQISANIKHLKQSCHSLIKICQKCNLANNSLNGPLRFEKVYKFVLFYRIGLTTKRRKGRKRSNRVFRSRLPWVHACINGHQKEQHLLSYTLFLTHTHTHTHSLSLYLFLSICLSVSLSPSLSHTLTLFLSFSFYVFSLSSLSHSFFFLTHTRANTHSLFLFLISIYPICKISGLYPRPFVITKCLYKPPQRVVQKHYIY